RRTRARLLTSRSYAEVSALSTSYGRPCRRRRRRALRFCGPEPSARRPPRVDTSRRVVSDSLAAIWHLFQRQTAIEATVVLQSLPNYSTTIPLYLDLHVRSPYAHGVARDPARRGWAQHGAGLDVV